MSYTIVKTKGEWVVGSFTTGLIAKVKKNLKQEASKNLLAVINRLHREGNYELAEELFDEFA